LGGDSSQIPDYQSSSLSRPKPIWWVDRTPTSNKKPKGAIDLVYCRSVTKDGIEKAQKQLSLVFVENTRAMLLTRLQ